MEYTNLFFGNNNSMPEQVEENRSNIKALENIILTETNPRGKWISGLSYDVKDSVYLNSGYYVCRKQILDSTVTPDLDTEHWTTLYKNTYGQEIQVNTNNISNLRTEVDSNETRLHTAEDSITRIDDTITKKYVNCRVLSLNNTESIKFNQFRSKPQPLVVIIGKGNCEIRDNTGLKHTYNNFRQIILGTYANEVFSSAILSNNTVDSYEWGSMKGFTEIFFTGSARGLLYIFNDYVNFENPTTYSLYSEEDSELATTELDYDSMSKEELIKTLQAERSTVKDLTAKDLV